MPDGRESSRGCALWGDGLNDGSLRGGPPVIGLALSAGRDSRVSDHSGRTGGLGIDSGIRHAVSGADYGSVRVGAFMGYRILQTVAGTDCKGYLANLTPSQFEQEFAAHLPVERAALTSWPNMAAPPTKSPPLIPIAPMRFSSRPPTPSTNISGCAPLATCSRATLVNVPQLGELMYQSHASYSACGLGSHGTDALVKLACKAGPDQGIYGAKITGGSGDGSHPWPRHGRSHRPSHRRRVCGRFWAPADCFPWLVCWRCNLWRIVVTNGQFIMVQVGLQLLIRSVRRERACAVARYWPIFPV